MWESRAKVHSLSDIYCSCKLLRFVEFSFKLTQIVDCERCLCPYICTRTLPILVICYKSLSLDWWNTHHVSSFTSPCIYHRNRPFEINVGRVFNLWCLILSVVPKTIVPAHFSKQGKDLSRRTRCESIWGSPRCLDFQGFQRRGRVSIRIYSVFL